MVVCICYFQTPNLSLPPPVFLLAVKLSSNKRQEAQYHCKYFWDIFEYILCLFKFSTFLSILVPNPCLYLTSSPQASHHFLRILFSCLYTAFPKSNINHSFSSFSQRTNYTQSYIQKQWRESKAQNYKLLQSKYSIQQIFTYLLSFKSWGYQSHISLAALRKAQHIFTVLCRLGKHLVTKTMNN